MNDMFRWDTSIQVMNNPTCYRRLDIDKNQKCNFSKILNTFLFHFLKEISLEIINKMFSK